MDAAIYKGLTAQQHRDAFVVFEGFLKDILPRRVLDIGTAHGGFTLFLRDALDALGLRESRLLSFDIQERSDYSRLRERGIEVRIENIFERPGDGNTKLQEIRNFIRDEGTTLVLCDGGNKVGEFCALAPFLKVGDFIMAHDYVETAEEFRKCFAGRIWNWCEVEEKHIEEASRANQLVHYKKEIFSGVVWVCKRRAVS